MDGAIQFSILATKSGKVVAVDVAVNETEVDVAPVLELYVKLLDAKPDIAVFVAMPKLTNRAREVALKHGIAVAEGSTPDDVALGILNAAGIEPQSHSPSVRV
jgi:hypothetical protein